MSQPYVSVLVTVYNHRDYIEECLRSIAMQKTTFPIEVIVGDDCSPDGTQDVLRKLEEELPSFFNIICREKNIGSLRNGEDLYDRAQGKYLVDFEGDDFMLYDGLLQEEVAFLDSHPDYSAVYTNCIVVGKDSQPLKEGYPECKDSDYSYREYFLSCLPGHNGSRMSLREDYINARAKFLSMKEFESYPGDRRNAFLFLTMGKVRCIQEPWVAYRHIRKGGSSYSATLKKDKSFALNEVGFGRTLVSYALITGDKEAISTAKQTCYRMRFRWCHGKSKVENLGDILRDISKEDRKLLMVTAPLRWYAVLISRLLRGRAIV
ncbi:glycosyltransferase family 2 protein [Adlercreutzia sp. ZJ141]|uniref:glycosyltransferase family 2 protein n=1 Tax=Adlercreutzia sp. ZJ141 TaxID=2709406 RepID=UPI0013EB02AE|nr:glycosyltransferase family A protein [Adlercreutzia sp. ZJ141]